MSRQPASAAPVQGLAHYVSYLPGTVYLSPVQLAAPATDERAYHCDFCRTNEEPRVQFRRRMRAYTGKRREQVAIMAGELRSLGYDVSAFDGGDAIT